MSDRNALIARLVPFLQLRRYEPGERIPSERELAERFGVSRGQIREALSYLEALRVIERRAKSGVYMANEAASVETLASFVQIGIPLTAADVRQSVEMRKIHEIAAIALACDRRTEENLARMREILEDEARKVKAGESIAEDDRLFHSEIIKSTQNNIFFKIANIFYIMTKVGRNLYFESLERCRQSHAEHVQTFDAVRRRNTQKARELMEAHLTGVDSYWQGLIEKVDSPTTIDAGGTPPELAR
jgi:DNA-binding FadR family transcriptional regulator